MPQVIPVHVAPPRFLGRLRTETGYEWQYFRSRGVTRRDGPDENRHVFFIEVSVDSELIGRLEANLSLEIALSRVAELRLLDEAPPYVPIFFIRCPERFRVELTRA